MLGPLRRIHHVRPPDTPAFLLFLSFLWLVDGDTLVPPHFDAPGSLIWVVEHKYLLVQSAAVRLW